MSYPTNCPEGPPVQLRMTSCVPVPVSDTDCGLPPALSVMASEALRDPAATGSNEKVNVHEPPAGTDEPQVLFSAKSVGSDPLSAMLEMFSGPLPILFRVMV